MESVTDFLLYRSFADLFDSNFSRDTPCLIFTKGEQGKFTSIPLLLFELLCVTQVVYNGTATFTGHKEEKSKMKHWSTERSRKSNCSFSPQVSAFGLFC